MKREESETKATCPTISEHLERSYNNTQKLIQFQDLKSSTIIGLSTISVGVIFGAFKWIVDSEISDTPLIEAISASAWGCLLLALTGLAILLSLGFCIACLWMCTSAIIPRTSKNTDFRPYALFPVWTSNTERRKLDDYLEYSLECFGDESRRFVNHEYQVQLIQVGRILGLKIEDLKQGIRFFRNQLFSGALGIMLCYILSVIAHYIG